MQRLDSEQYLWYSKASTTIELNIYSFIGVWNVMKAKQNQNQNQKPKLKFFLSLIHIPNCLGIHSNIFWDKVMIICQRKKRYNLIVAFRSDHFCTCSIHVYFFSILYFCVFLSFEMQNID